MGNGIPAVLPAPESKWEDAQKVVRRLSDAMLEQRKKELNPSVLKSAIDTAEAKGFNRSNTPLVAKALGLQALVKHKFAETLIPEYKYEWEWEEANKDPGGELYKRLAAVKAEEDRKIDKRKKPEKSFNIKHTNNPEATLKVANLRSYATEDILRRHFDGTMNGDKPFSAGNFLRCHVSRDASGRCTGTAFLEYKNESERNVALGLDGMKVDYDRIEARIAEGPQQVQEAPVYNTISFMGNFGWIVPGDGLFFEENARSFMVSHGNIFSKNDKETKEVGRLKAAPVPADVTKQPESPTKGDKGGGGGGGSPAKGKKGEPLPPPTSAGKPPSSSKKKGKDEAAPPPEKPPPPPAPRLLFYSNTFGKNWVKVVVDAEKVVDVSPIMSVTATSAAGTVVLRLTSGSRFSSSDFGDSWSSVPSSAPDPATVSPDEDEILNHAPPARTVESLTQSAYASDRRPHPLRLSVPPPIGIPPASPAILRCVRFRVDSCCRSVRAVFFPPFKDLFPSAGGKPLGEQAAKDRKAILDYIEGILATEDVLYLPSGGAMLSNEPWGEGPAKKGGAKGLAGIQTCKVCFGLGKDHQNCVKVLATFISK